MNACMAHSWAESELSSGEALAPQRVEFFHQIRKKIKSSVYMPAADCRKSWRFPKIRSEVQIDVSEQELGPPTRSCNI